MYFCDLNSTQGSEQQYEQERNERRVSITGDIKNDRLKIVLLQAGKKHYAKGNPGFEANFQNFEQLSKQASEKSPDIIVFPEFAISGWKYPVKEEINKLAEKIPGNGKWYSRYCELARKLNIALLGWLVELDDGKLYNCAFIVERDGSFLGKYRKVHANSLEQSKWDWSRGNKFEIIEFRGFKLGISICADMFYPESVICERLMGADIIIHISLADDMREIIPIRAKDSSIPIAAAIFQGGSFAIDPYGYMLGKAWPEYPEWIYFELQPYRFDSYNQENEEILIPKTSRNPEAYSIISKISID